MKVSYIIQSMNLVCLIPRCESAEKFHGLGGEGGGKLLKREVCVGFGLWTKFKSKGRIVQDGLFVMGVVIGFFLLIKGDIATKKVQVEGMTTVWKCFIEKSHRKLVDQTLLTRLNLDR